MKKFFPFILLMLFIVLVSTFYHYPLHIQDVLAEQPAEQFGIKIHSSRILFEPIVGPMLFMLRADQPEQEMAILLLWTLAFMLIALMAKKARDGWTLKNSIAALGAWLLRLPLVIIIWLAVMVFIIFLPLPSNTIINNDANAVLLNTHSHSEWSHDGLITQEKLWRWHKRNGFDAFFITDHNTHEHTLQFVQKQKAKEIPPRPLVMAGEEFSGSNHITLLGLRRQFITRGQHDSTVIDSAHANGGVAIVAHWFADEHHSIQHYIDLGADGFEIVNQAEGLQYSRRIFDEIVDQCRRTNLLMTGACDYHGYGSAALTWTALEIPGHNELNSEQLRQSIMELLRRHGQDKITVLMYKDRTPLPRNRVFWSPLYNLLSYWRTLNIWQVVSWIIWLVTIALLSSRPFFKNAAMGGALAWLSSLKGVGFLSAAFVLAKGLHLLSKVAAVRDYNEIYAELGSQLAWIGSAFMLYILLVVFVAKVAKLKQRS